jgi:DNA polymerase-3 subunit delta
MRLQAQQLVARLEQQLAPVYLLSGDEPLQLGEAADSVRSAAKRAGYSSRRIMEAGARFDWNQLTQEANSMSLFAEQKIIDLRIPSGKPGRDGSASLSAYCERIPDDTLLLLTLPKLDKSQLNSKWFKALDKVGFTIQIWPVERQRLPAWINQRMRAAELIPAPGVADMLADQVEGNLLAARQEIEKLALLYGTGKITMEQLRDAISDSARFDVFGLVDSALAGNSSRCTRMLSGLRAEGMAAAVILWALAREIRALARISRSVSNGTRPEHAMAQAKVWSSRQPLVRKGLQRLPVMRWEQLLSHCQYADSAVKGAIPTDPWLLLEQITLGMCGVSVLPIKLPSYSM